MRTLGLILLVVGLIVGLGLALLPTSALHSTGSCGPPVIRVMLSQKGATPNATALLKYCVKQSKPRLLYAAIALVVGVGLGGLCLAAGRKGTEAPAA
jgi:hypothetical protein